MDGLCPPPLPPGQMKTFHGQLGRARLSAALNQLNFPFQFSPDYTKFAMLVLKAYRGDCQKTFQQKMRV